MIELANLPFNRQRAKYTDYWVNLSWSVGQNVQPLNKREYILDIATEAEPIDSNYSLWFRRVIWNQPLKFDNELGVTMHYNQVCICQLHTPVSAINDLQHWCHIKLYDGFMFLLVWLLILILQVVPDYLKALLNVVPQGNASEQQLQQVSKLAALQHRAKDSVYLPTM